MIRTAAWVCFLAMLAFAASAEAQLVIDRSAPTPYPMPPKIEPEEEEAREKPPPTYSGERMQVRSECEPERLQTAGAICTASSPCEIWLELTAAREADEAVVAIGDLYTSAATLESIVLRTADAGATWTEAAERIAGAALDEIHFVDDEHGWIVGREVVGGGQRPFLLATDDGGASWSRRQVEEDEDYRGTVVQLRFDSPEHGFVIVERAAGTGDPYEMRETFNGGRSWSLRQITADRPALPGSRRRVPQPDARVVEDSNGRSFAVQRRDGDAWALLGRFEGSADVCGPE